MQRLSRAAMRGIVAQAELQVIDELDDPLPRRVHMFFADTLRARLAANAKWLIRSTVHRASPAAARHLFTLHYACLCLPRQQASG